MEPKMSYTPRQTLKDFDAPVTAQDLQAVLDIARGKRTYGDQGPYEDFAAYHFQLELAVPQDLVRPHLAGRLSPDLEGMSQVINDWLKTATQVERATEIIDALLGRTESVFSDQRWEDGFAREFARVFDADPQIARKSMMNTPSQKNKRWGRAVAEHAAAELHQAMGSA